MALKSGVFVFVFALWSLESSDRHHQNDEGTKTARNEIQSDECKREEGDERDEGGERDEGHERGKCEKRKRD